MLAVSLLTIATLLAGLDDPDPSSMVRQLGSDKFSERVEATKALEKLGPTALPALRAARDSADPRVRVRASAILKTIESSTDLDRLTRPKLLKLDFHDRPLGEVIETLNARHNLGLTLQFGPIRDRQTIFGGPSREQVAYEERIRSQRITLEAPEPLPFWSAIDRLCLAANLRQDLQPQSQFGLPEGRFLLYHGIEGKTPASDQGPIRVVVAGMHATFERDFLGDANPVSRAFVNPGPSAGDRDLSLRMGVIPEPGLLVRQAGPARLLEAIDDRGRSLLPLEKQPDDPPIVSYDLENFNGTAVSMMTHLRLPDQAGRSIRRFRGSIPVVVVAYAPRPIVIPLSRGAGATIRNEEATVTLLEITKDDENGVTVEVEVVPNRPTDDSEPIHRPGPPDFVKFRTSQLTSRLELVDANGDKLPLQWTQGHGTDMMTINRRIRLTPTIRYEDQPADDAPGNFQPRKAIKPVPVELRYHGFIQTLTEIRFDFHNIPLP